MRIFDCLKEKEGDMSPYNSAKIVGQIDLVFSLVGLLIFVILVVCSAIFTELYLDLEEDLSASMSTEWRERNLRAISEEFNVPLQLIARIMWISAAVSTPVIILQVYASKLLINSTAPECREQEPAKALQMALLWRGVSIVVLIIYTLLAVFGFALIPLAIVNVCFRIVFLVNVADYVDYLRNHITSLTQLSSHAYFNQGAEVVSEIAL